MSDKKSKSLVFVYNAQNGWLFKLNDFAHKILSPTTYACDLCRLTHGALKEKREWTDFLKELDYEVKFYYKNENNIGRFKPPYVVFNDGTKEELLISNVQFSDIDTLNDLISLLKLKLSINT